jgi:hypothetical protein
MLHVMSGVPSGAAGIDAGSGDERRRFARRFFMMPARCGILNWLILRADMSQKFFKEALFCDNVCRSSPAFRQANTSGRTLAFDRIGYMTAVSPL